jgi:hypothetical protein
VPCGPARLLLGHIVPCLWPLLARARDGLRAVALGHARDFGPLARIRIEISFSFSYSIQVQTSKIHIYLSIASKFMKLVLLDS